MLKNVFSYFVDKVTMPFLNCVEKCDQKSLTQVLPILYKDLPEGKLNTLSEYKVEWAHIQIDKQFPSTELDKYLLLEICKDVA